MGKIVLRPVTKTVTIGGKKGKIELLDNTQFDRFNPRVLGLGDISLPSKQVEAVAAVFDLAGFTDFCNQHDPQLSVPEYLSRFLDWLFDELRKRFIRASHPEGKELWADLPFLAKFAGDGILFLWDCKILDKTEMCNILIALKSICDDYARDFYPKIKSVVVDPPGILRCGITRGRVFSVGNGQDYVGPCINIAATIQKLSLLTFCFSRRGFDIEKGMAEEWASKFVAKVVAIPGVGEHELVCVLKEEFESLPEPEKALFQTP